MGSVSSTYGGAGSSADSHVVQLYDDRRTLVEGVTAYAGCALLHGEAALVVVTAEHRAAFAAALTAGGMAVDRLRHSGQYVELDAQQVLSWATGSDGTVDLALLTDALGDQLDRLAARWGQVSVYGDLVACLWARGDVTATVQLEHLWNALTRSRPVRLYCGYDSTDFADQGSAAQALQVLTAHSEVRAT
jgi:hypothetical protein